MAKEKPDDVEQAPEEGAIFMHLDDFLGLIHSETQKVESVGAYARIKKAKGQWKMTEEAWRADFDKFLTEIPK